MLNRLRSMENSYALKFSRESFFPPSIGKSSKSLNYRFAGLKCLIIVEPRICIIIFRDRCRCNRHCARYTRRHDCYYETRENVSGSNRYSISGNKTADRVRVPRQQQISVENLSVCTRVLPYLPVECGETCAFQSRDWERARGRSSIPPPPLPRGKFHGSENHGVALPPGRCSYIPPSPSPVTPSARTTRACIREYIDRTPLTFESSLCPPYINHTVRPSTSLFLRETLQFVCIPAGRQSRDSVVGIGHSVYNRASFVLFFRRIERGVIKCYFDYLML